MNSGSYTQICRQFGDLSVLPTSAFFDGLVPGDEVEVAIETGVSLYLAIDATAGQCQTLRMTTARTTP